MLKYFKFSILVSIVCLLLSAYWGYHHGVHAGGAAMLQVVSATLILAVMEVSLSFDNAVVNATVLKHWNPFWKMLFLTLGILVAVFGMRLLFPLLIVGLTSDLSMFEVAQLALNQPTIYAAKLADHHAEIVAFGGMFLLLVFLHFIFDQDKDIHWFKWLEQRFTQLGKIAAIEVFIALSILLFMNVFVAEDKRFVVMMAGIWGIVIYIGVQVLSHFLAGEQSTATDHSVVSSTILKGGIAGFVYLEILDASFSFDGVLGAFAISNDIVVIMLGLAIGAMFIRSLTVYLVDQGTLESYIYLEHGAHYAIGALALIMLASATGWHISEIITGLIGIFFIIWSSIASISHQKNSVSQ